MFSFLSEMNYDHMIHCSFKLQNLFIHFYIKGYCNIFSFGLSISTFEVIVLSTVQFLTTCFYSGILRNRERQRHHPLAILDLKIKMTSQAEKNFLVQETIIANMSNTKIQLDMCLYIYYIIAK